MPKVSIIIPVYNVEKYLNQCLDSILNQTINDIEIICINDGSTDNSLKILQEYQEKDTRIKIIDQENTGQGIARNNALKIITGEYLGFVDPDDYVLPQMFETLYNAAITYGCDIVEESFCINNEVRNYIKKKKNKLKLPINKIFNRKIRKNYLFSPNLAVWNKLYKSDFIKNNNIYFSEFKRGEDIIFTVKSRVLAEKIVYIDAADYQYRIKQGDNNKTYKEYSSEENAKNQINFLLRIKNELIKNEIYDITKNDFETYALQKLEEKYKTLKDSEKEIYTETIKTLIPIELFKIFKKQIYFKNIKNNIFSVFNTTRDGKKVKIFKILGLEIFIPYNKI